MVTKSRVANGAVALVVLLAVVVYMVRRGELVNVVAHYDNDTWSEESWIREVDRSEVIENYRGWHESLMRLFSASDKHYKWALYDRDPLK